MESLLVAWRFLLLTSIFAFPQLLGILLYLRLGHLPRWFASIAAVLTPGILFFWLAPILLFSGIREAYAAGEMRCGMPAMAALLVLFAGTIIQLVLGVITQVALYPRTK